MYRIKGYSFIAWWLAASVLVWPMAAVALGAVLFPLGTIYSILFPVSYGYNDFYGNIAQVAVLPIAGAVVAFVLSSMQRWLLRSRLYWAADGWRLWSVIGGAVGGFVLFIFFYGSSYRGYFDWTYSIGSAFPYAAMPIFLAFVAGCQSVPLRHAVRHSWLWWVANVVAAVVFTGVLTNNQGYAYYGMPQMGILVLAIAALGLVTGSAILHLFERHILPMKPEGMEDFPPQGPRSVWDDAI